jgi:hypothetical protein
MLTDRSSHSRQFTTPIPTFLSDRDVITGLHDHNNVLTLQALITGHKEVDPESYPTALTDPSFPADRAPVKCYEVTEGVIVIPGIGDWGKMVINFPAWFQDTPNGLYVRADPPGGVMVRAEWRVEHTGSDSNGDGGDGGDGNDMDEGMVEEQAEFLLVEDLTVECVSWMMPFVRLTVEGAHRDICWKLVEKLANEKRDANKEHDTRGR